MTSIIRRSGNVKFRIGPPLPTWLQNAINAASGTGLTTGLPLYQWYKLDPRLASGRPNGWWSQNSWGSQAGLVAPGDITPDNDFRADPNFPGFQWQHADAGPNNTTTGHYEATLEPDDVTIRSTNFVSRHIDSCYAWRRSGSVLLLHGAGHNSSWRNDVAEIHLGSNNVTRQVITPATPYDMIRYCMGPGASGTHPKHYLGSSWDVRSVSPSRFHNTKYMDGRPIAGHCGYKNIYNDEHDLLMTMGTGLMHPGAGASNAIEAWRWSTKDWDKPTDYVSPSNPGAGMPRYGEILPYPNTSQVAGYPGSSTEFTQPMNKLIGQNRVIIPDYARASETPVKVYAYDFPGPGFTELGTMSGQNMTVIIPPNPNPEGKVDNHYPFDVPIHDPVRNRMLMINNYIYRGNIGFPDPPIGFDWRAQEGDYAYARMGYLDLDAPIGSNLYRVIPQATYDANPALRAKSPSDPICYDEAGDRYLIFFMKGSRDPRSNVSATNTYAGLGGLFAGQMPFNKLYAVDPDDFSNLGELPVTPDPVYGVPPGIFRGAWKQVAYFPEIKCIAYLSDTVDRVQPLDAGTSTTGYGNAGGQFIWIMRVG